MSFTNNIYRYVYSHQWKVVIIHRSTGNYDILNKVISLAMRIKNSVKRKNMDEGLLGPMHISMSKGDERDEDEYKGAVDKFPYHMLVSSV